MVFLASIIVVWFTIQRPPLLLTWSRHCRLMMPLNVVVINRLISGHASEDAIKNSGWVARQKCAYVGLDFIKAR